MKILYAFLASLLFTNLLFAQEVLAIDSVYFNPAIRATPLSVIDNNQDIHLFFTNSTAVARLKYNNQFEFIEKGNFPKSNYTHNKEHGFLVDTNNSIHLYFSRPDYRSFLILSITEDGESSEKIIDLDIENEKVIDAFALNNDFHVLTYAKKSSLINRYTINDDKFQKITYDLYSKGFCEKINGICDLKEVFKKQEIQFISPEVPAVIGQAVKRLKLFPSTEKNQVQISSDHRLGSTLIITLQLDDNSFNLRYYGNDYNNFKANTRRRSNSFLFNNNLFQILASKRKGMIFIKDLSNNKVLKKFEFNKESNIYFNNSEIYQDNGSFSLSSERIRDTKVFLNQITSGRIGLVANDFNEKTIMIFGGISTYTTPVGPGIGIPIASFGSANLFMSAFGSVKNSKATYTRSLLNNESFEQETGFAGINIFELIHVYKTEEAQLKKVIRENIFRYEDYFIYGFFDTKKGTYSLLKF